MVELLACADIAAATGESDRHMTPRMIATCPSTRDRTLAPTRARRERPTSLGAVEGGAGCETVVVTVLGSPAPTDSTS
ncbi:hypothetical protein GCM10027298_05130 [Epidermidibacterium keratini]